MGLNYIYYLLYNLRVFLNKWACVTSSRQYGYSTQWQLNGYYSSHIDLAGFVISILYLNPAVNHVRDSVHAGRHSYLLWLERRFNPLLWMWLSFTLCCVYVFVMSLFSCLDFSSCAFHWSENNVVSWLFSVVLYDDTVFHSAEDLIQITDLIEENDHYKSEPIQI